MITRDDVDLENKKFTQVIEELGNGKVRVYNIVDMHIMHDDDPVTTIIVKGFEDHEE